MTLVPVPDKSTRQEIIAGGERALSFARRVLRVAQIERENTESIKAMKAELAELREQVRTLREREELLISRMETAVTRAAADTMAELARRIGFLEGRASRD